MVKAQRDSIRLLQGVLVAAIVVPAVLFGYAAWLSYKNVHEIADREIARTTQVINEHALKVFEAVDHSIAEINEAVRNLSDAEISAGEQVLHEHLKRIAESSAEIKSLWIFSRNGRALVNSLTYPVAPGDYSDRDYFAAHVEKDIGVFVGSVLVPRPPYGGAPFFGVSRRRFSPTGEFNGVIQASVLPEYFQGFYEKLASEPGAYASLVREDGVLLARYPPLNRAARLAEQGPLYQEMLKNPGAGKLTLKSAIDGMGRQVAYHKLDNFPVFVLAGLETAAIRDQWLSQIGSELLFGLPATCALVAIIALALRRTRSLYVEAAGRQAAEEALRQSQRLEALGQLTGGVAHDFNNLLMIIGGSVERARTQNPSPQMSRTLSMMASAVQKGEGLTRRLLSFARGQALSPIQIDLAQTVEKFLDVLRQSLRGNIELNFVRTPEPLLVDVDPEELEIALLNLTLNARDAMPQGGKITIAIHAAQPRELRGQPRLSGDFAVVAVTDNGSGIPQEVQARIFEPFFTTKADKGTGLGLSQVYGFAQQSNGAVRLETAIGKGTTFRIFLPRSLEKRSAAAGESRPESLKSGARVLLVEDNLDVAEVAAAHLEQCGCTVVRTHDAQSAIEHLTSDHDIDLIFSDIVMPGMSGVDLGRWTRRHRPGTPIILTTGYSDQGATAVREGFSLLPKPYSFAELTNALARSGMKCRPPE